jgi:putative phosphoesterase
MVSCTVATPGWICQPQYAVPSYASLRKYRVNLPYFSAKLAGTVKQIGLISDTHGYMDDRIVHHLSDCDEIWHAGDIGNLDIMQDLEKMAVVRAVYGNIDGRDVRQVYPKTADFEVEGLMVLITHIAGRPGRYPTDVKAEIARTRPGVFVCGHSHICLVNRDLKTGLIHMNPGAAGRHGFHKVRTMLKLSIANGALENLRVIELGSRASL